MKIAKPCCGSCEHFCRASIKCRKQHPIQLNFQLCCCPEYSPLNPIEIPYEELLKALKDAKARLNFRGFTAGDLVNAAIRKYGGDYEKKII